MPTHPLTLHRKSSPPRDNLGKLYDELYAAGQRVLDRFNPCELTRGVDGVYTCVRGKPDCCTGCKHLGPDGCTVEALGCKLGACWCHSYPVEIPGWKAAAPELIKLKNMAWDAGINPGCRDTKREVLRRARRERGKE